MRFRPHNGRFDERNIFDQTQCPQGFHRYLHGIINPMNSIAELAHETSDSVLPAWVQAQIARLQIQLAERDAELKRRELKISQLTLELAHHRRIRFGCKSEAFSP